MGVIKSFSGKSWGNRGQEKWAPEKKEEQEEKKVKKQWK